MVTREVAVLVDVLRLDGRLEPAPIAIPTEEAPLAGGFSAESIGGAFDDNIVPGEVLVLFDEGAILPASLSASSVALSESPHVRLIAVPPDAVGALSAIPGVRAIEPNRFVRPVGGSVATLAGPLSDEHFALQWSLNGLENPRYNLAPFWAETSGSDDVVIAIVDTGIVADPARPGRPHPDLDCGRTLAGASFLRAGFSNTLVSEGAFETPGTRNQYHGTHVAGIAAACSDNGIGVAGVDRGAMLLPIRVFNDAGDGTLAEVLMAARWAAGLTVPGIAVNPNPADVINFSLGASGSCADTSSSPVASVLASVAATGAILVAAAGNSGATNSLTPANCPVVISVGAVGPNATVTSYSNRGPTVDVYAPGGEMSGGRSERGMLSTYATFEGAPAYAYLDGTSMAAPYVAGLLGLLRALHPDLHSQQALRMLQEASDVASVNCRLGGRAATCAASILDPTRLVGVALPPRLPTDDIFVAGTRNFGAVATALTLRFTNAGESSVAIESLSFNTPHLSAALYGAAEILPGGERNVLVELNRTALRAQGLTGVRVAELSVATDVGTIRIPLTFDLGGSLDLGPLQVTAMVQASEHGWGGIRHAVGWALPGDGYQFTLDIDLSLLRLRHGDQLVLSVHGSAPPSCPGGEVLGETRIPLGPQQALSLHQPPIHVNLVCPQGLLPKGLPPPLDP